MIINTQTGSIVYRLEEDITDLELNIQFTKGDILSHETLNKLICNNWYEIKVSIIVLQ